MAWRWFRTPRGIGPIAPVALFLSVFMGVVKAQPSYNIEIVSQISHSGGVTAIAFSPDGRRVLSGGDTTVKLWDVASGKLIRNFEGASGWVKSVAFSPDGRRALSGSFRSIKIWDAASGMLLRDLKGHSSVVASVAFSPDGKRVLSGGYDATARVWDSDTGDLIQTIEGHSGFINSVAFSPDGKRFVTGSADATIRLWDATTGDLLRTFRGHSKQINSVAFSHNGARLLSGSGGGGPPGNDNTVRLWDIETGLPVQLIEAPSIVNSVAFSHDDSRLLSGGYDGKPRLWNAATGEMIGTFEGHAWLVQSVAFSPDDANILSGSVDDTLLLWTVDKGSLIRTFGGRSSAVSAIAYSPNGLRVASAGDDHNVNLWDASTGTLLRRIAAHSEVISSLAFSPDSASIISGSWDKTLKLWNAITGDLISTFEGHSDRVSSVVFSPDGTRLVSGSGDPHDGLPSEASRLRLWDVASGTTLSTFGGHSEAVQSVAFSPDGKFLAIGTYGRGFQIWDASTGAHIGRFAEGSNGCTSVAFSADGTRILCGGVVATTLWDARKGTQIYKLSEHPSFDTAVAFSPDGTQLLLGYGNTLELWNASNGTLIRRLSGHLGQIVSVAFSPDGKRMLSGSRDSTARIWDLGTGRELVQLIVSKAGDWLAITQDGFFTASDGGTELLSVVRGVESYSVMQFYEQLYQPDLVGELLQNDPLEKYGRSARELNLRRILNSGAAPILELVETRTELLDSAVRVRVRVKDEGGGIGKRIVWRVNGQARGETNAPELQPSGENSIIVEQILKVSPAQVYSVQVVAYNKEGLLASVPLLFSASVEGAVSKETRMHVLAIGITAYEKEDWRLNLAASDAMAIAQALQAAGKGLFTEVKTTTLLDKEATTRGIEAAFAKIAKDPDLRPNDVFVLYIAAHGRYDGARYYFIPQEFNTDLPPKGKGHLIRKDAVSQDTLQRWIASVQVDKRLVVLDTCESAQGAGSLIRAMAAPRLTAMQQLQHATGDNLIAAAGQSAFESNKLGHGLLTYAVLEAFAHESGTPEEKVTTDFIASHATERVPVLSREIFGQEQWPIRKLSSGSPIPLGYRRAALRPPNIPSPIHRNYILVREEIVRTAPDAAAISDPPIRLPWLLIVNILDFNEERTWMRIQWGSGIGGTGVGVGWVPADAVHAPGAAPQ